MMYADRLTLEPAAVTEADIQPPRDAGLEDRGVHDVCAIVAYFAFVNRMADGLGVELEPERRDAKDARARRTSTGD